MDPEAESRGQAGRAVDEPDSEYPAAEVRVQALPEVVIPESGILGAVFPARAPSAYQDRGVVSRVQVIPGRARMGLEFRWAGPVEGFHSAHRRIRFSLQIPIGRRAAVVADDSVEHQLKYPKLQCRLSPDSEIASLQNPCRFQSAPACAVPLTGCHRLESAGSNATAAPMTTSSSQECFFNIAAISAADSDVSQWPRRISPAIQSEHCNYRTRFDRTYCRGSRLTNTTNQLQTPTRPQRIQPCRRATSDS